MVETEHKTTIGALQSGADPQLANKLRGLLNGKQMTVTSGSDGAIYSLQFKTEKQGASTHDGSFAITRSIRSKQGDGTLQEDIKLFVFSGAGTFLGGKASVFTGGRPSTPTQLPPSAENRAEAVRFIEIFQSASAKRR